MKKHLFKLKSNLPILIVFLLLFSLNAVANSSLFFLETQFVSGYNSAETDPLYFYSSHPDDAMQKPSIGFDYLQNIQLDNQDLGRFAVQARIAFNLQKKFSTEFQLYNFYYRHKLPGFYLWLGHNKVAYGLSSYLNSHGLLFSDPTMQEFGFGSDWGIGYQQDTEWGNIYASYSTGSGMSLNTTGSNLMSFRAGYGVLDRDNFTIGLSSAYGKIWETMGIHIMDSTEPMPLQISGLDAEYRFENIEIKGQFDYGQKMDEKFLLFFIRESLLIDENNQLKCEFQQVYKQNPATSFEGIAGLSFQLNPDYTCRIMTAFDDKLKNFRLIGQIYFYSVIF